MAKLELEWQRYTNHFGNDEDNARHAFFMGMLTMLQIAVIRPEAMRTFAEELDQFLAEGCACPSCAAKRARGAEYSLVRDLFGRN
jgi:hypothetical protein